MKNEKEMLSGFYDGSYMPNRSLDLLLNFELDRMLNCDIFLISNYFYQVANVIMGNSDTITLSQMTALLNKSDELLSYINKLKNCATKDLEAMLKIAWYISYFHDCRLYVRHGNIPEFLKCRNRPIIENALMAYRGFRFPRGVKFKTIPFVLG
ncbi:MAG: hypothetical protein JKY31_04275 [Rhodobacteraceae bacterium]|nr:hypothetical protein [Paracoccaceae bacterium]